MSLRLVARTVACVAVCLPASTRAVEPMIGAEFTWPLIEVADETFSPPAARLRLALALTPDWEVGVAGGSGIDADEDAGVAVELSSFREAYVRYSAPLDDDTARLVLSLGYGETVLDVQTVLPGFPGAETYSGVVWGVSLQERLSNHPHWVGSLDYQRWFDDDGLTISTISYGFRYAF